MRNRKVQSLRGHESHVNAGLCFIAVNSWSPSCSFSETDTNTFQRGPDIVSAGRILEQNQVFWCCPDTKLLWTDWNMLSSLSHHYFKLLWLIGDNVLLSIIICSVFSISCSRDSTVEPKILSTALLCRNGENIRACREVQLFLTFTHCFLNKLIQISFEARKS